MTKVNDYSLSKLTAVGAIKAVIVAENKLIWDTIEAACAERQRMCELKELSKENEATLKDNGFKVNRVEMMGGTVITVKWG